MYIHAVESLCRYYMYMYMLEQYTILYCIYACTCTCHKVTVLLKTSTNHTSEISTCTCHKFLYLVQITILRFLLVFSITGACMACIGKQMHIVQHSVLLKHVHVHVVSTVCMYKYSSIAR